MVGLKCMKICNNSACLRGRFDDVPPVSQQTLCQDHRVGQVSFQNVVLVLLICDKLMQ